MVDPVVSFDASLSDLSLDGLPWMSRTGSDRINGDRISEFYFTPIHTPFIRILMDYSGRYNDYTWMSQEVSKWLVSGL